MDPLVERMRTIAAKARAMAPRCMSCARWRRLDGEAGYCSDWRNMAAFRRPDESCARHAPKEPAAAGGGNG